MRTTLSTSSNGESANTQTTPLPALLNRSIPSSKLRISLPLAISYQKLASSLQQRLTNKPLEYKQGDVSISIKTVEIYPNNDRLVLAAKVKLDGLLGLLSSDGEIYISGKPIVDNQTKSLKLAEVEFSRRLDSKFWNVTTKLLHTRLLEGLQNALVYDFSKNYNEARQSINQQFNGWHGKKIKLNGQLDDLKILNIQPDLEELRLILEAEGILDLELTKL